VKTKKLRLNKKTGRLCSKVIFACITNSAVANLAINVEILTQSHAKTSSKTASKDSTKMGAMRHAENITPMSVVLP